MSLSESFSRMHEFGTPDKWPGSPSKAKSKRKDELVARSRAYNGGVADASSWLAESRSPVTSSLRPQSQDTPANMKLPIRNASPEKNSDSEDDFKLYTGEEMRSMFSTSSVQGENSGGKSHDDESALRLKSTPASNRPARITNLLGGGGHDDEGGVRSAGVSNKSPSPRNDRQDGSHHHHVVSANASKPDPTLDAFFGQETKASNSEGIHPEPDQHLASEQKLQSLHKLESENARLVSELAESKSRYAVLETQFNEASSGLTASRAEVAASRAEVTSLKSTAKLDHDNLVELNGKIAGLVKEQGMSNQELAKTKQQLAQATSRLADLDKVYTSTLQALTSVRQELLAERSTSSSTIEKQASDIARLESEVARLNHLATGNSTNAKYRDDALNVLTDRCEKLQTTLHEVAIILVKSVRKSGVCVMGPPAAPSIMVEPPNSHLMGQVPGTSTIHGGIGQNLPNSTHSTSGDDRSVEEAVKATVGLIDGMESEIHELRRREARLIDQIVALNEENKAGFWQKYIVRPITGCQFMGGNSNVDSGVSLVRGQHRQGAGTINQSGSNSNGFSNTGAYANPGPYSYSNQSQAQFQPQAQQPGIYSNRIALTSPSNSTTRLSGKRSSAHNMEAGFAGIQ